MLVTHHSNRLEDLAAAVAARMAADPLPPLVTERIVVPHRSMAHWLSIELAERHGIVANLEFPFLGALVWSLFQRQWPDLPARSAFDREALRWRVMERLPGLLGEEGFAPLRAYLDDGDHANGIKAYQLADRLAGLYDAYLVYRTDWILDWEADGGEHWQARLWRALIDTATGTERHRAGLLQGFIAALTSGEVAADALPPRLTVFGVSSAPPAYLDLLAGLGEYIPVDVLALNPSLHYWGDVVSERGLARLRELWRRRGLPDASDYYEVGNPLLSSLGRTGRDFLELLHERSGDDEYHFPEDNTAPATQLARVQQDILLLRDPGTDVAPAALDPADDSISLHACHSPMREVQVLHDRLRRLFAETDLQPRDVVVMTPDIDTYAPFIEAVFGNAGGDRAIPWSLTDRALSQAHPAMQVFATLLGLPRSRLTASEVLSVLEVPTVHRAFELDADAVERIRGWVRESGIRWGADAAHRAAEALPARWETHSWRFGMNRLLLGYAVDDDTGIYRGIAPLHRVEGGEAAWLGGFRGFWDTLLGVRESLRGEHTARQWQGVLNGMLDRLFQPFDDEENAALQRIRDVVASMVDSAEAAEFSGTLPIATVRAHLLEALDSGSQQGGYLTGQVTFCAMVPMRSVPFRAVCLIGLNDRDFPRQSPPMAFDLMAAEPRKGDRSLREDDRYLFLEALLSARDHFHVSYVGRSIRDDNARLPSVLVNEFTDTLDRTFASPDEHRPSDHLLTEHPLQPFSARYTAAPGARLFSYADDWLLPPETDTATATVAPATFCDHPLPPPDEALRQVALEELIRFLRDPAEAFLRLRLGTRLQDGEPTEEDSEPFDLDSLAFYSLKQHLLGARRKGHDRPDIERLLTAAGALPEGPFADAVMDEATRRVDRFHEDLEPLLPHDRQTVEVDLALGEFRLTGWLADVGPSGLLTWRPARVRAHDELSLWVKHLALNAVDPVGITTASRHLGEGEKDEPSRMVAFAPMAPEVARQQLADLLELYWQALQTPLPLFPESSLACAERLVQGQDEDDALKKARGKWQGLDFRGIPGEKDRAANAVVFRDRDPIDDPAFGTLALRVFEPLIAGREAES